MIVKKLYFFLIIILLASATFCLAQEPPQIESKIGWTEIYDEKLKFAIAFPSDFLIDAGEKRDSVISPVFAALPDVINIIEKPELLSHLKSVSMNLKIYDLRRHDLMEISKTKDYFGYFYPYKTDKPYQDFKVGDMTVRKLSLDDDKKLGTYILLGVKNKIIVISAFAEEEDFEIYERFLTSMKINGKTFLKSDSKKEYVVKNDRVSIDELRTSSEVLNALNQKSEKRDFSLQRIQIEPNNKEKNKEDLKFSRPLIILRQPRKYPYLEPGQKFDGIVKVKVSFQKDGKIGDITFLSDAPKLLLRKLFAEIQEIKFLPAEVDRKKINLMKSIEYRFNLR